MPDSLVQSTKHSTEFDQTLSLPRESQACETMLGDAEACFVRMYHRHSKTLGDMYYGTHQ